MREQLASSRRYEPKPDLAINSAHRTVADALTGFIDHAATGFVGGATIDIATAYFNVGGYSLLADSLDRMNGVRILLGAEPTPPERRRRKLDVEPAKPERATRSRLDRALTAHERDLAIDRDLLGFSFEADYISKRLVEWLRKGTVEVRRLETGFLHGKAFLVSDNAHGVLAGSSNFTYAGLTSNLELNLGNYSAHVVNQVKEWYQGIWEQATDYDLAGLFEARFEPHSPYLIFLRMLWERYGEDLQAEAEADPRGASDIHLTSFQTDGLWRARRILAERNGVLIADEVGLGKTFLAGELIREATMERRQRVLVITPATLRDGPWRAFRSQYNLPMELVSYEELMADSRLNPSNNARIKLDARDINDYAMIVIDEAHNLRNPSTQRAEALRRLLAGSPPKQLVLLTATPVNNSLWDLYHQISYFLRNDAAFADIGIPSMRDHFARAMALKPDDLTPEHLFDVLDAVAVRRTRSFVKNYYPNDTVPIDGREHVISFPTPRVLKVTYDFDAVLPGFFNRVAHALLHDDARAIELADDQQTLTLARYVPSRYRKGEEPEKYEVQLAGLLRSGTLKRFESSPHAFARTCERMAKNHDAFLALLQHGRVATGDELADWISTDSDDLDAADKHQDHHIGLSQDATKYDIEELTQDVTADRDLLRSFASTANSISQSRDPNLAQLVEELADIAADASLTGIGHGNICDRRKVLIFTYYADTVDWIYEYLVEVVENDERLSDYRGRIASLSGSTGAVNKEMVIWGFAPRTTDAPEGSRDDLYDIVVTTDVLAEGVNLQQARHIINYDLPWNPMRLVQRHGRIDRIGSPHSEVFIRCVFPDTRLDDFLNLEDRLQMKIRQAAVSIGVGEVLPEQPGRDITFSETREEIERIRAQDSDLFERGGTARGVLSGEEYRQQLRQAIEQGRREQIERLPWGSGSGMATDAGSSVGNSYVFCARVGDRDQPVFRYVASELPNTIDVDGSMDGSERVVSDTLTCLDHARPPDGFDTPRTLDDDAYMGAFNAWDIARDDIVRKWNHLADKANLEPQLPPALLRAVEILRNHSPTGATQDDIDRAIDSLSAPYPVRTIRTIRVAMNSSDDPNQQAALILEVVQTLGLEPYVPPAPRPEITPDDVHLVCWLALS